MGNTKKKMALLSVYHKNGIVEFAQELLNLNFELLASGGTAKTLTAAGLPVTDVAEFIGGGAILGHKVVTLARPIYAGLLASADEIPELEDLGYDWVDLVCVDLYPLIEEINKPDCTNQSVIEKTDIGGPTLLRAAAKGRRIVVCDPSDRQNVIDWLKEGQQDKEKFLNQLAAKTEYVVSEYALSSAQYHSDGQYSGLIGQRIDECKYGENPWQLPAALYTTNSNDPLALDKLKLVAGTTPSFNNYVDVDRLLQTVTHIAAGFEFNYGEVPFMGVAVKHGNPCGAAIGSDTSEVLQKMIEGDPLAIFGGLVMVNFPIDEKGAEILLSYKTSDGVRRILDGILAPSFTEDAINLLKRKKDKCRFIINPALENLDQNSIDKNLRVRPVRGGFLKQQNYTFILNLTKDPQNLKRSGTVSTEKEKDLLLAWAIGSTSNSNTITIVKDKRLLGNGTGQQDRVGGCHVAIYKAQRSKHDINEAVAYSDSFFPFTDGPELLINAGVKTILATSGSVKDQAVIDFCQERGVAFYNAPDKEIRGFFGH